MRIDQKKKNEEKNKTTVELRVIFEITTATWTKLNKHDWKHGQRQRIGLAKSHIKIEKKYVKLFAER